MQCPGCIRLLRLDYSTGIPYSQISIEINRKRKMYTRLQNVDPPRENASGTSPSLQQVGSCSIANIIIKLVTRIHELWSRHYGCTRSTDQSIEVDSYYSKFDTESMHQRGAVISLRPMIQKAVRFQY